VQFLSSLDLWLEGIFTISEGVINLASTNKTANLGLSQWEKTDPFSREDLNADLAKIDRAAGVQRTKLIDRTLTEKAQTVELDFSGLDLSEFIGLELFTPCQISYLLNSKQIEMEHTNSSGSWQSCSGCASEIGHFKLINNRSIASTAGMIHSDGRECYRIAASKIAPLQSLLFSNYTGGFSAGERFIALGVSI